MCVDDLTSNRSVNVSVFDAVTHYETNSSGSEIYRKRFNIYTLPPKSLGSVRFLTEDPHQSCIYLIKNTEKSLILSNIITI